MKIKGKLLAGGLMTAIACGIAGSITSTFAGYQSSNSHTASMHGVSVGVSQNLQLGVAGSFTAEVTSANDVTYENGNLNWSKIQGIVDQTQLTAANGNNPRDFILAPVSNGANDGQSKLNNTWYGNPDGSQSQLPVVEKGFMQFSFYARIAETDGSVTHNDQTNEDEVNYTYPEGMLYLTDIAGLVDATSKLGNALRMHIQFGDSATASENTYVVVNPVNSYHVADPASDENHSVLLKATYSQSRQYDWEENATSTDIIYRLPTTATTDQETGSLVALSHKNAIATATGTNGALVGGISHAIPGTELGLKITVTLWLEGFETAEGQATGADDSQWWDVQSTVGKAIKAGFELTAVAD